MKRIAPLLIVAIAAIHGGNATAAPMTTVATLTTVDYRAVVVAEKTSGGLAPTAAVHVDTFVRSGGHWRRLGTRRLAGTFFWKVVTAPQAVCGLEIVTLGIGGTPRVVVQLLETPSLGCGGSVTVPLS